MESWVIGEPHGIAAAWETEPGPSSRQSTEAPRSTSSFLVAACVVRTWNLVHYFPLRFVSGSHAPCFFVLPVEYRLDFREILVCYSCAKTWFDSGCMFCIRCGAFGRMAPIFYGEVDSDPEVVFLRSLAEWRSVLSRCFSFHPFRTVRTGQYFLSFMRLRRVMMESIFAVFFYGMFRPPLRR